LGVIQNVLALIKKGKTDMDKQKTATSEEEIYEAVRQRYGNIAETFDPDVKSSLVEGDCCSGSGSCCDSSSLYDTDLSDLPVDVTGMSLGCGDPLTLANLEPGQTVLDLGSGGGIDCFLAARQVGESGWVIGIDMTKTMIEKAEANLAKVGLTNVEFRLGKIEQLPVEDATVDVILSNCVINLSPDKPAVFKEAFRVLRPGGRLTVTDIVTQGKIDQNQRSDMDSWAACVAGAEDVADYLAAIREAGFADISLKDKDGPDVELANSSSHYIGPARIFSGRVVAHKPN
jgi:SAM-dependent methyltransferase